MLSLDTEGTGLDLHHGCKPFMLATCDEEGLSCLWEWDVDPLTRMPIYKRSDWEDIAETVRKQPLVIHNSGYDVAAVSKSCIGKYGLNLNRGLIHDTLLASHILDSGSPHDLTSLSMQYLGYDIQHFEDKVEKACNSARNIARHKYPDWRIAKKGDPMLPSQTGKFWKADMWLLRAVAKAEGYFSGQCEVVNMKSGAKWDVRIDRETKWGNPYVIGRDGNRAEVIKMYEDYLYDTPSLLDSLHELDGKILGCHCDPLPCHGDVLKKVIASKRHPWYHLVSDYCLSDVATGISIWKAIRQELKDNDLWEIYLERRKLLPVVAGMANRGITYSDKRLSELLEQYQQESDEAEKVCIRLSKGALTKLPKSGASNALKHTLFDVLKVQPLKFSRKTKEPSTDRSCLVYWSSTAERGSRQGAFLRNLLDKRKRDTAISYMGSYRKFGIRIKGIDGGYILYPSVNLTGTSTLRCSSSHPNSQNFSKQPGFNLRYLLGPLPGREWWALDYENIELRLPAYEAGEQDMIDLFEKPDEPPFYGSNHLLVASVLYPREFAECLRSGVSFKDKYKSTLYQWTKNGNFAVQYGAMEESGTADLAYHYPGAQRIVMNRFNRIAALNQKCIEFANEHGYIETMKDRSMPRGYPLVCKKWHNGEVKPTIPLNYRIQGTAMWCMSKAMVRCHEYLEQFEDYYIIAQVHDELVFDFPQKRAKRGDPRLGNLSIIRELKRLMELSGDDVGVPLRTSIAYHPDNYGSDAKISI